MLTVLPLLFAIGTDRWTGTLREIAATDINPTNGRRPSCPQTRRKGGAVGDARPPTAGLQRSAGDVGLAVTVEVADLHIDPGNARRPSGPKTITERSATRNAGPPLSVLRHAADDVVLAIAVEIAHLDIDPRDRGIPHAPYAGSE